MNDFSALDRPRHLETLTRETWDLLVVGGGITGAGIALDAASRGLKVALVEKRDFAWGTSSRSTKLIHGGLRYLKQLEIGLVRKVGQERAVVFRNARHIVRPEPMLLPIYEGGAVGRMSGAIGLWFYDFLADVEKSEKRKMLSRTETLEKEPLLKKKGLLGGGLYYEYRTDDARLTIDVLKTAVRHGAHPVNYCELTSLTLHDQKINGAVVTDVLSGRVFPVAAKVVVNAAGPWADEVRSMDPARAEQKSLVLTKGVHLVVAGSRLPVSQSVYFDVPGDNRMVFCIPRDGVVYMGTTDTVHDQSPDKIPVRTFDITYILDAVNAVLPGNDLTPDDIISTWAGVRPLIYEKGKAPSELSRKDEIYTDNSGLITIAGGKLTGYRIMAERIVDLAVLSGNLTPRESQSVTREMKLVGCTFNSEKKRRKFLQGLISDHPKISPDTIRRLFNRYGAEITDILHRDQTPLLAEIEYAIHCEMTHNPTDFMIQRTGAIHFERAWIKTRLDDIVTTFAEIFAWSTNKQLEERRKCDQALTDSVAVSAGAE